VLTDRSSSPSFLQRQIAAFTRTPAGASVETTSRSAQLAGWQHPSENSWLREKNKLVFFQTFSLCQWTARCFPSTATFAYVFATRSCVALEPKLALNYNQAVADFTSFDPIDETRQSAGKTSLVQCFSVCIRQKVVECLGTCSLSRHLRGDVVAVGTHRTLARAVSNTMKGS
jgi:hypothetical protein